MVLALRVKPPTACLIDSIVCVAVLVPVATGAIVYRFVMGCGCGKRVEFIPDLLVIKIRIWGVLIVRSYKKGIAQMLYI